jgi:hypothetical protein
MEEIKLIIRKPYARQVIEDLEKMEAISIQKKPKRDPASFIGSWRKQTIEEIDAEVAKLRDEWQRDFS